MIREANTRQAAPDNVANQVLVSLRKIIQSIATNSRSLVKRVGLTGPQLMILQEIGYAGETSVGEVAKAMSLSQGTVTGILERMEKRGLVSRRRSDSDRRVVLAALTETGNTVLEKAPPLMQEDFVERFNSLEAWEQAMILSTLQRLVAIMDGSDIRGPAVAAAGLSEESPAKPGVK